jgi:hypothetical protein
MFKVPEDKKHQADSGQRAKKNRQDAPPSGDRGENFPPSNVLIARRILDFVRLEQTEVVQIGQGWHGKSFRGKLGIRGTEGKNAESFFVALLNAP